MEIFLRKGYEDEGRAWKDENGKFHVLSIKEQKNRNDGRILDSVNTGSMTKKEFGAMVDFCDCAYTLYGDLDDFKYGGISLDELKVDMQKMRKAVDRLPVFRDAEGNDIYPPARNEFAVIVKEEKFIEEEYAKNGGVFENGTPVDNKLYNYLGLVSGNDEFIGKVLDGTVAGYVGKVNEACGTDFDLDNWFDTDGFGDKRFNENGNLCMCGYSFRSLMHEHENGKEFAPLEFDEDMVLEGDLVSNFEFDVSDDYYDVIARLNAPERQAENGNGNVAPVMADALDVLDGKDEKTEKEPVQEKTAAVSETKKIGTRTVVKNTSTVVVLSDGTKIDLSKESERLPIGTVLEHKTFKTGTLEGYDDKGFLVVNFPSQEKPVKLVPQVLEKGIATIVKKKEKEEETVRSVEGTRQETVEAVKTETVVDRVPEADRSSVGNTEAPKPQGMVMDDLFGFIAEEDGVAESKPVETVKENTEDKHMETEIPVVEEKHVEPEIPVVDLRGEAVPVVNLKGESVEEETAGHESEEHVAEPVGQVAETKKDELVMTKPAESVQVSRNVTRRISDERLSEIRQRFAEENVVTERTDSVPQRQATKSVRPATKAEPAVEVSKNGLETVTAEEAKKINSTAIPHYYTFRVFADRAVGLRKGAETNEVNRFLRDNKWINLRLSYDSRYKGYTVGIPSYFVSEGISVGRDRKTKTLRISIKTDREFLFFMPPGKRGREDRIRVNLKDAIEVIQNDMSPRSASLRRGSQNCSNGNDNSMKI